MLVDANVLLYATDERSAHHVVARDWLERALNGRRRVGLPWASMTAFLRIVTNPRALEQPLTGAEAWEIVETWLASGAVWIPEAGSAHRDILGRLIRDLDLRANLIPDAALAAICIEHGLTMVSADSDFARFTEIAWLNPIAA